MGLTTFLLGGFGPRCISKPLNLAIAVDISELLAIVLLRLVSSDTPIDEFTVDVSPRARILAYAWVVTVACKNYRADNSNRIDLSIYLVILPLQMFADLQALQLLPASTWPGWKAFLPFNLVQSTRSETSFGALLVECATFPALLCYAYSIAWNYVERRTVDVLDNVITRPDLPDPISREADESDDEEDELLVGASGVTHHRYQKWNGNPPNLWQAIRYEMPIIGKVSDEVYYRSLFWRMRWFGRDLSRRLSEEEVVCLQLRIIGVGSQLAAREGDTSFDFATKRRGQITLLATAQVFEEAGLPSIRNIIDVVDPHTPLDDLIDAALVIEEVLTIMPEVTTRPGQTSQRSTAEQKALFQEFQEEFRRHYPEILGNWLKSQDDPRQIPPVQHRNMVIGVKQRLWLSILEPSPPGVGEEPDIVSPSMQQQEDSEDIVVVANGAETANITPHPSVDQESDQDGALLPPETTTIPAQDTAPSSSSSDSDAGLTAQDRLGSGDIDDVVSETIRFAASPPSQLQRRPIFPSGYVEWAPSSPSSGASEYHPLPTRHSSNISPRGGHLFRASSLRQISDAQMVQRLSAPDEVEVEVLDRRRRPQHRVTALSNFPASALASHLAYVFTGIVLLPLEALYLRSLARTFLAKPSERLGAAEAAGWWLGDVRGLWDFCGGPGDGVLGRARYVGGMVLLLGVQSVVSAGVWGVGTGVVLGLGRRFGWGRF